MAEALFLHKAEMKGLSDQFEVDSCGTGDWHVGQPSDSRTIETLERHGVRISSRARQISKSDLHDFDHILVMDESNYKNVNDILGDNDKVRMMRSFDGSKSGADVPDPYFGGADGFEKVYSILDESTENLINELTS